jgi:peptide/nickel transport system ATP-binding protein
MVSESELLLRIDRLRVEADDDAAKAPLVDGISLTLERGEVLGLIGESGAGKSTIGLAALGYARPGCRITEGRVLLDGTDLLDLSDAQLRVARGARVAYVAQSAAAAFNPAHRLINQVCEVPVRHGLMSPRVARRAAVDLFRRLLLPDPESFGERYPHQVSGGQLQRAMTAMAMICKPDLIVLDEPTTALDATTQIEVLAILRTLIRQDRLSALYITHDLALVAQLATRLMVLRNGSLVEEGPTERVLTQATSPYTRALVAARTVDRRPEVAPGARTQALLETRAITARYGSGPSVLRSVSLRVASGEVLAIVGESGSGKSTLARAIAGLLPPTAGEILFNGVRIGPLVRRDRELRRRIQLVHQSPDLALNPRARVADIIARPLELFLRLGKTERRGRVLDLLRTVGLTEDIAGRWPGDLSGGQKQRVCIARALAAEPALLICDEITASLDALAAKEILDLLHRLRRQFQMACLLITHDFGVVEAMADRVAVMFRGEIVETGPRAQILAEPRTEYTARLLFAVPELDVGWMDSVLATGKFGPAPAPADGRTNDPRTLA